MYTTLYILVNVIAFPICLFIISRAVILLEKKGILVDPKKTDNRFTFSMLILAIFVVYFSLSGLFTYILDMFF